MPTLHDVAKRAGVSTATVSKVLSNTPYFSDETRDKVMSAVQELGYRPNLAARALSSGRTHAVAVVFPYIYDTIFNDPLVMQILEGVEAICNEHGYNIILSTPRLTEDGPDERYRQLIQSGYVEGVIAIDNVSIASVSHIARDYDVPVVVIGYHNATFSVRSDDFAGGCKAAQYILDLGHEHIGIITVPSHLNLAIEQRMRGIQQTFSEARIHHQQIYYTHGDFSAASGRKAMAELRDKYPEITAVICLNDRMAIGAIQWLMEHEVAIPDDISVVGYDDIPLVGVFSPAITTISQHAAQLGRAAVKMLFEVLQDKTPTPVVFQPDLIIRGSARAL